MLKELSGRTHSVFSGFCLSFPGDNELYSGYEQARITFFALSDKEIGNLDVRLMDTPKIERRSSSDTKVKKIRSLGPRQTIIVPVEGRISGASAARGNRFMVAVRVTWPYGEYGKDFRADLPRQQTVIKYIQLGSGS